MNFSFRNLKIDQTSKANGSFYSHILLKSTRRTLLLKHFFDTSTNWKGQKYAKYSNQSDFRDLAWYATIYFITQVWLLPILLISYWNLFFKWKLSHFNRGSARSPGNECKIILCQNRLKCLDKYSQLFKSLFLGKINHCNYIINVCLF